MFCINNGRRRARVASPVLPIYRLLLFFTITTNIRDLNTAASRPGALLVTLAIVTTCPPVSLPHFFWFVVTKRT